MCLSFSLLSLLTPAVCSARESRCREGDRLSVRMGGGRERKRKERKAEGSKGFTARSLAFQVMDMLVLV